MTVSSLPLQQQADNKDSYRDRGNTRISQLSAAFQLLILMSADEVMDCCDQLFPGFKTPQLWVAQQCRSSTPPPISRNCRHIDGLDLHSNGGGQKCTLLPSVKLADQNRPPIFYTIINPHWEILFSTRITHTRAHTRKHTYSVEEMSERAATHATAPKEQC